MKIFLFALSVVTALQSFNINLNPHLAVNGDGDAVALWEAYDGNHLVIQKATLPNGGSWGSPTAISEADSNASAPDLVINDRGEIFGVWQRSSSSSFLIESDVTSFGGMDVLKTISTELGGPLSPSVGVDMEGNAIAVWHRQQANQFFVASSRYLSSSGLWGTPILINSTSPSLLLPMPTVAVNAAGKAVAIWQQLSPKASDSWIQVSFLESGEAWTFPTILSPLLESARSPRVAIDSSGNVMAIWHESKNSSSVIVARFCSSMGNWGDPVILSDPNGIAMNAQIALHDSGKAVATWEKNISNGGKIIQAAVFSGTSWGAAVDLSDESIQGSSPQVALNALEEAIVSWSGEDASENFFIQSNFLTTGGSWSGPETLSDSSVQSRLNQVRFDGMGNAIAVWEAISGNTSVIQASFRPTGSVWQTTQTISMPTP